MAKWHHQPFVFEFTEEMAEKVQAWDKCADLPQGTIGGHISYKITPTSVGLAIKARCARCEEELDLTDWDSF